MNYVTAVKYDSLVYIDGILPKGPYPPCLRMADRAFWLDTLDIYRIQNVSSLCPLMSQYQIALI